jgi:hypothetical protein
MSRTERAQQTPPRIGEQIACAEPELHRGKNDRQRPAKIQKQEACARHIFSILNLNPDTWHPDAWYPGGDYRDRTDDLLLAKQALSQLS